MPRQTVLRATGARPSLRPFFPGLWFSASNGLTWMIGLGTPMVLLAEQLGASTFQVGLASAFVFLLLPVQVLSTAALQRLGYRRQMVLGWSLRALFLLIPLRLAWLAPASPEPGMPGLLVASVFGFCLLRAFGVAAHMPWMAAILPLEIRGRFFATDNFVAALVGVGTLLLCSALFARLPTWRAFVVVYGLALAGSLLAVSSLLRLPLARNPRPVPLRRLPAESRRLCLQRGPFRHYLLLSLLGSVVTSSLGAFTVFYLKTEAGLPTWRILTFTAAQYAGTSTGALVIRRRLDRTAIPRFFQAGVLLVGAVDLYWLALVAGAASLVELLPAAYFALGVALGISNSAHATYLPDLADEDARPVVFSVFTAVLGLLSGIAPMLWGLVLGAPGPAPRMDVSRFALYFAIGGGLSAVLFVLFGRLPALRVEVPAERPAGG